MKPRSRQESIWRMFGSEYRKMFQQGSGAAKTARNFTRKQCNKAMRHNGKNEIARQVDEMKS